MTENERATGWFIGSLLFILGWILGFSGSVGAELYDWSWNVAILGGFFFLAGAIIACYYECVSTKEETE